MGATNRDQMAWGKGSYSLLTVHKPAVDSHPTEKSAIVSY